MEKKMDRTKIAVITQKESEEMDDFYWANAPIEEKIGTVTFLRECFYGKEATTGRLQGIYSILKFK